MWIDIAVLAIIAVFAIIGLLNGFVKTLLSFTGFFLSIIVAAFFTGPVVAILQPTSIYTSITSFLANNLGFISSLVSSDTIFKAIVFIVLVIAASILVKLLKAFANALNNISLINFVDKLLGVALGAVFGVIAVYVIFYILSLLAGVNFLAPVFTDLASSTLAKFFFENNLIFILVNQFLTTGSIDPTELLNVFK